MLKDNSNLLKNEFVRDLAQIGYDYKKARPGILINNEHLNRKIFSIFKFDDLIFKNRLRFSNDFSTIKLVF